MISNKLKLQFILFYAFWYNVTTVTIYQGTKQLYSAGQAPEISLSSFFISSFVIIAINVAIVRIAIIKTFDIIDIIFISSVIFNTKIPPCDTSNTPDTSPDPNT